MRERQQQLCVKAAITKTKAETRGAEKKVKQIIVLQFAPIVHAVIIILLLTCWLKLQDEGLNCALLPCDALCIALFALRSQQLTP